MFAPNKVKTRDFHWCANLTPTTQLSIPVSLSEKINEKQKLPEGYWGVIVNLKVLISYFELIRR